MEKYCRPPLRRGDIVTVAQGLFDGLCPKQALARKMLFEHGVMTWKEADIFLLKIGSEASALLLEEDPKDLQTACLEARFVNGQEALEGQYFN